MPLSQPATLPLTTPNGAPESLLGPIADEFLRRLEAGEQPSVEEYVQRHPEIADTLRRMLSALLLLEHSGAAVDDAGLRSMPLRGVLGDFHVLHEIGRGGMGVVYEAEQISLGRRVALKILPFASILDPRQLTRFQNEARATATLNHPHIVPVYTTGVERGVHYLAMRLIDGESLAKYGLKGTGDQGKGTGEEGSGEETNPKSQIQNLKSAPATTLRAAAITTHAGGDEQQWYRRVAQWGVEAAEALEHAHSLGIIHRDVKPGNLLIDGEGKLWVTDFGLARLPSDAGITMTGDILGTLRYMSPEQALARHGLVDHRTDIYSLGATLYELLTGQPVVRGKDREEILKALSQNEATPLRKHAPRIAIDLETVVMKAIARDARERYETAKELGEDLVRVLRRERIHANRLSLSRRMYYWSKRNTSLLVSATAIAIVMALAAGGVAVVQVLSNGKIQGALTASKTERDRANENWLKSMRMLNDIGAALVLEAPHTHICSEIEKVVSAHHAEFLSTAPTDPDVLLESIRARYSRIIASQDMPLPEVSRMLEPLLEDALSLHRENPESRRYSRWRARLLYVKINAQSGKLDDPANRKRISVLEKIRDEASENRLANPSHGEWSAVAARATYGIILSHSASAPSYSPANDLDELVMCIKGLQQFDPEDDTFLNAAIQMCKECCVVFQQFGRAEDAISCCRVGLDLESRLPAWISTTRTPPHRLHILETLVPLLLRAGRDDEARKETEGLFDWILSQINIQLPVYGAFMSLNFKQPPESYEPAGNPQWGIHPEWLLRCGNLYGSTGQPEEAAKCFEKARSLSMRRFHAQARGLARLRPSPTALSLDLSQELLRNERYADAEREAKIALWFAEALTAPFVDRANQGINETVLGPGELNQARANLLWCRYVHSQLSDSDSTARQDARTHLCASALNPIGGLREQLITPAEEASIQNNIAWNLLTAPHEGLRDAHLARELAKAATERADDKAFWNSLGVAGYRCADFPAAEAALQNAISKSREKRGAPEDWLFLAMTQAKLGRMEEAKLSYDKAIALVPPNQVTAELQEFRKEAEEVLAMGAETAE